MRYQLVLWWLCYAFSGRSQPVVRHLSSGSAVAEIRSYTLRPGTRDSFHRLVLDYSLPMLQRWKIGVLGYGPSLQEDSSYYLVRLYPSLEARQRSEDAFYGSSEWKNGPREAIVSRIINYTTVIVPVDSLLRLAENAKTMIEKETRMQDSAELSALNRQFIENFIHQDAVRHDAIIHKDFVCIQNDGSIVGREEYLKGWPGAYTHSGYTDFSYTDETIRIFGDVALVRSKTVYTKKLGDKVVKGNSVYTDTYKKENGSWLCVQAQITPVAVK
jgi:ketosteroid isomerase-like protein